MGCHCFLCMMCSTYKLNKQGDNIQSWCTPFPILNQSIVPCLVLTVASWPAYKFLRRQVRWSGIPISLRILQFVVIHTVKGFGIVNEAEVDVFLELLLFRWSSGCWQFDQFAQMLYSFLNTPLGSVSIIAYVMLDSSGLYYSNKVCICYFIFIYLLYSLKDL